MAALWKRTESRATGDPLTGEVRPDPRSAGPSPADEAALEWALRIAETTGGTVLAVSAGDPSPVTDMLRGALAVGAARAVVVDLDPVAPSNVVAAAVAPVVAEAAVVCCGDASLDRGSGSVPAFLADRLGRAQALGLVGLEIDAGERGLSLAGERRLDRGRRERVRLRPPAVLSVEAAAARLRRASLIGLLSARQAGVERVVPAAGSLAAEAAVSAGLRTIRVGPYRPRARVVPPPPSSLGPRDRIRLLTGAGSGRATTRVLRLEPDEAAELALATLAEWGELP